MDWGSGLHVNGHFMSSENPPLTRIPAGAHAHLCGCCAPLAANVASLKDWSAGENGKVPPLGQTEPLAHDSVMVLYFLARASATKSRP